MTTTKRTTVLVVDDQSNIRLLVRTALETDGFTIIEAADGRDAIERVRRDRPDVMLLDLNMPVLDGMSVLARLEKAAFRPRIIVLTAYGSISAAVRAIRLGASNFVEKPITPDELRNAVRGVLDEPASPETIAAAEPPGGYDPVLDRVRRSLRQVDLENAESLLAVAAERRDSQAAAYFNLLALLYESQHRWRLARRCYRKALDADPKYEPARTNEVRLGEMIRFGRTDRPVVLGDEPDDIWYARIPAAKT